MITAVDTNILLDILITDETYSKGSKKLLDTYIEEGQLVVCEIVYAELASQFLSEGAVRDFFADTGIKLINSDEKTLYIAGERWAAYTRNKKRHLQCAQCGEHVTVVCPRCNYPLSFRQRIISDFIIGAHALMNADLFLSRDRGFYGTYFKDLKISHEA